MSEKLLPCLRSSWPYLACVMIWVGTFWMIGRLP